MLCSECGSRIQDKWSLAGFIEVVRTLDVFAWIMGAVFLVLGFFWPPGYIITTMAIGFGLLKAIMARPRYLCPNCKRAFTFEEVHGNQGVR